MTHKQCREIHNTEGTSSFFFFSYCNLPLDLHLHFSSWPVARILISFYLHSSHNSSHSLLNCEKCYQSRVFTFVSRQWNIPMNASDRKWFPTVWSHSLSYHGLFFLLCYVVMGHVIQKFIIERLLFFNCIRRQRFDGVAWMIFPFLGFGFNFFTFWKVFQALNLLIGNSALTISLVCTDGYTNEFL